MNTGLMDTSTMIWFKPTEKFFAYFAQVPWRWKQFHDCGTGMGFLTQEMRKRKFDVKAYDMFPRGEPLIKDIRVLNTGTMEFIDYFQLQDCAILARPCHHPEFIDDTLDIVLDSGGDAFYVGLANNIVRDLENYYFKVVAGDVGEAGEVLVRIFGHVDKLKEYRQLEQPFGKEWWWYSKARDRYGSMPDCFSGFDADGSEKILDTRYYGHDLQVYELKAEACNASSSQGWIAPDGEWFGVSYGAHDGIMQSVVGIQVGRAEKLGFCRCHGEETSHSGKIWTQRGLDSEKPKKPTAKQKATLIAKGYDPKF